jgi:hypothetical protein
MHRERIDLHPIVFIWESPSRRSATRCGEPAGTRIDSCAVLPGWRSARRGSWVFSVGHPLFPTVHFVGSEPEWGKSYCRRGAAISGPEQPMAPRSEGNRGLRAGSWRVGGKGSSLPLIANTDARVGRRTLAIRAGPRVPGFTPPRCCCRSRCRIFPVRRSRTRRFARLGGFRLGVMLLKLLEHWTPQFLSTPNAGRRFRN